MIRVFLNFYLKKKIHMPVVSVCSAESFMIKHLRTPAKDMQIIFFLPFLPFG